jgi:hypothetical protein
MHKPERLNPQTARIEIHSFDTQTLTDNQLLPEAKEALWRESVQSCG